MDPPFVRALHIERFCLCCTQSRHTHLEIMVVQREVVVAVPFFQKKINDPMYHVIALYHENIVLLTIRKQCFEWKLIAFKELNVHHIELLWVQGKVESFPSEGYSLDVTELPMHFLEHTGHLGSLFSPL